ncbi:Fe2+-dependent dioxygenase [Acinetobacter sp. ANC 5579]|uniref:Fe2+-dependent dioxygenase n=1 Tax=Acinetobacter TaxID=469 RepID=UPI0009939D3B|nr:MULTISPECIES: Fe2+-dependent dioxygenase [Acinetobacter]MCL6235351.1 Fe2+-dependent dioxygenase [Acinetobacter amyesii]MCL6237946.1 Fe2+-dependent dioxygenase [Acinetobacter amyesii]MCL6241373.1 Fe2+-dependent dioxygenase [Acinetobacter amyesii]OOV83167.1 Fe2+-dependent dioxygenase [Acinetobacter sp. ANC 5600]UUS58090.1 Fe2+-dependent dioxygenase [Acinetobacter sp. YH16040_T]
MIHHIPNVLSKEQVNYFRTEMQKVEWINGQKTTGSLSKNVKNNQQLDIDHPLTQHLGDIILHELSQHALFTSAALPLNILPPYFNRYENGETFGFHVDNAIRWMPDSNQKIRTDLSCTIFLSEPEEYEGGELVVEDTYGYHEVKLPAGDLILYPSTSVHEVTPVTAGCRIASFFWLQSMIREDAERHMLFNLDQSIQNLRMQLGDAHSEVVKLTSLYHNLIRKWAEI